MRMPWLCVLALGLATPATAGECHWLPDRTHMVCNADDGSQTRFTRVGDTLHYETTPGLQPDSRGRYPSAWAAWGELYNEQVSRDLAVQTQAAKLEALRIQNEANRLLLEELRQEARRRAEAQPPR